MKKIIALILASLMILSMVACGGSDTKDTTKAAEKTTAAAAEKTTAAEAEKTTAAEGETTAAEGELSAYDQAIADRRAEYEKTGVYQVVNFTYYVWSPQADTARINEALNVIFREELCLELDLQLIAASDFRQNVPLMLNSGEKIDWFTSSGIGFTSAINQGFCMDLEEDDLIYNYGPHVIENFLPEYMEAARVGGILYCVPPIKDVAINYAALMIGKEYLDGIGYEYVEDPEEQMVKGKTWDEISEIFAQLHEQYPDISVLTGMTNWFTQGSQIDPIGGDSYGVLEHPCESLEVTNLFGCDEWNWKMAMIREWNKAGYYAEDTLTESIGMNSKIKAGNAMVMLSQAKPGYKSQISGECGREMIVFEMGEPIVKASGVTNICSSIAYCCEDPIAAMQAMDLFSYSAEAMQLIIWGEEGIDYVYTEDGHVTYPEGVDASNATYHHTCNWEFANQYLSTPWVGDPLDLGERTLEFNANAKKSLALGFTFNNSDYSSEYTALSNKYSEMYKMVMFGFAEDPVAYTEEMNAALKTNGLDEYIAAKAAALDEWAAAKGK